MITMMLFNPENPVILSIYRQELTVPDRPQRETRAPKSKSALKVQLFQGSNRVAGFL